MSDLFSTDYPQRSGNPTVDFIVDGFLNEHAEDFEYLLKEWNPKIRDFIRIKTGLRLGNDKTNSSQIPIKILPDQENRFSKIIDTKYPGLNLFEFIALRDFINSSSKSRSFLTVNTENKTSLDTLLRYSEDRLSRYDLKKIGKELLNTLLFERNVTQNQAMDVMGTYFGGKRKIELYYVPIILISEILDIRKDSVFRLVLCHELAHAYHHLGKDGDNKIWESFFAADSHIIEGLAELYTLWFIEKNGEINRRDLDTFRVMERQYHPDSPYVAYRHWKNIDSFETLRDILYVSRRNWITSYPEFLKVIHDSSHRF